jgi:glycosyltransferase involved in cell wall biosynthesis
LTVTAPSNRILFCSEHCIADPASGAAISAVELFGLLQQRGWDISALTGTKMDGGTPVPVSPDPEVRATADGSVEVHRVTYRGLAMRVVRSPEGPAGAELVRLLDAELEHQRREHGSPPVVLTYGGGETGRAILATARRHNAAGVFWLRNTFYERRDLFENATAVIVPSLFTSRFYQESLGLRCQVLYPAVVAERVRCHVRQPRFLTFVSPLPGKGVFIFARLASELHRLRPDIEVQVIEGRGDARWLTRTGLDITSYKNLRVLPRADDPRTFYSTTKVLLLPSVWPETFGRTAVEAMLSGIPVLGSDRGSIPEVLASPDQASPGGGVILPVPERIKPDNLVLPTVAEVKPWFDAVVRLWDDDDHYRALSKAAQTATARFDPDTLADHASNLFRGWATPN